MNDEVVTNTEEEWKLPEESSFEPEETCQWCQ